MAVLAELFHANVGDLLWMELDQLSILLGFLVIGGGAIATYYKGVIKSNKDLADLEKRSIQSDITIEQRLQASINQTITQITAQSVKIDVIWATILSEMPKVLMKPTHARMDDLLDRLTQNDLNDSELYELDNFMKIEMGEYVKNKDGRATAAALVRGAIELKLRGVL